MKSKWLDNYSVEDKEVLNGLLLIAGYVASVLSITLIVTLLIKFALWLLQ